MDYALKRVKNPGGENTPDSGHRSEVRHIGLDRRVQEGYMNSQPKYKSSTYSGPMTMSIIVAS